MSGFVFHPNALEDLEEIQGYIAADSVEAADRVLEELYEAIKSLVPFPRIGHSRPDPAVPYDSKSCAITSLRTRLTRGLLQSSRFCTAVAIPASLPPFWIREHKGGREPRHSPEELLYNVSVDSLHTSGHSCDRADGAR
jgi:plasmid stabilization system protein ParE